MGPGFCELVEEGPAAEHALGGDRCDRKVTWGGYVDHAAAAREMWEQAAAVS